MALHFSRTVIVALVFLLPASLLVRAEDRPAVIPLPPGPGRVVSAGVMQRIYDEVKTPYKYGVVIKGETNELVDCLLRAWATGDRRIGKRGVGCQPLGETMEEMLLRTAG